jgi:hypothetical protein
VVDFKGSHFEREIVLWGVRWYVAYPISYRQLEEMMEERGVNFRRPPNGAVCISDRFLHKFLAWLPERNHRRNRTAA